jgi:hypothetical protein
MQKVKKSKQISIRFEKNKDGQRIINIMSGIGGGQLQRIKEKYECVFDKIWCELTPSQTKELTFEQLEGSFEYQLI